MVSRMAAVASSPVRSQRAMFPAPTSVTVADPAETVMDLVPTPAAPSLSVTVIRTVLVPAAVQVCVAVMGLDWPVVLPVLAALPSPPSTEYVQRASVRTGPLNQPLTV